MNPMLNLRIPTLLCILFVALPLVLSPAAHAGLGDYDVEVAGLELPGGCEPKDSEWMNSGTLKVFGLGVLHAEGYATNGCGGHGCDDRVQGKYRRGNGAMHDFVIWEVPTDQGCMVSCYRQTFSDPIVLNRAEGYIAFYSAPRDGSGGIAAKFLCGPDDAGRSLFKGNLEYPCYRCPTLGDVYAPQLPSVEYGVD